MALYVEAIQSGDRELARRIDLLPAVLSRNHFGRNYDALGRVQIFEAYASLVDPNIQIRQQDFYLYLARIMTVGEIESALHEIRANGGSLGPFEMGFLQPEDDEDVTMERRPTSDMKKQGFIPQHVLEKAKADAQTAEEKEVIENTLQITHDQLRNDQRRHPLVRVFMDAIGAISGNPNEEWSMEDKQKMVDSVRPALGGLGLLDSFSDTLFDVTRPDFQIRFKAIVGALSCMKNDVIKQLIANRFLSDDVIAQYSPYPLLDREKQYSAIIRVAWLGVLRRKIDSNALIALSATDSLIQLIARLNRDTGRLDEAQLEAFHLIDPQVDNYIEALSYGRSQGRAALNIGEDLPATPYRIQALLFAYCRVLRLILYPGQEGVLVPEIMAALKEADIPDQHDARNITPVLQAYDDTPIVLTPYNQQPVQPAVRPYTQQLIYTDSMFENQGGQSCPYDSMFVSLFKIPGTFLQQHIWNARQVYCRVPIDENPQCKVVVDQRTGAKNADLLHRSIMADILAMQGVGTNKTVCATYKLWKTCVEVEQGGNSLVDDPRTMSLRMCEFYGLKKGVDFAYVEVDHGQFISNVVRPAGTCRLVIVSLKGGAATSVIGTTIPLTVDGGLFTLVSVTIFSPGHWMAAALDPRSGQWWFFNDLGPQVKKIKSHSGFPGDGVQKGWVYMRTDEIAAISAIAQKKPAPPPEPEPEDDPMDESWSQEEDDDKKQAPLAPPEPEVEDDPMDESWTPEEQEEAVEEYEDPEEEEPVVIDFHPPPAGISENVWRDAANPSPGELSYTMPRDSSVDLDGAIDMKDQMGRAATLNGWKITGWDVEYMMPDDVVERKVRNEIIDVLSAEGDTRDGPRTLAQYRMLQEIVSWPRNKDPAGVERLEEQSRIFLGGGGRTYEKTFPNYSKTLRKEVLEMEEREEAYDPSIYVPVVRDEKKEEEERRVRELDHVLRLPEDPSERVRRVPSILISKADPRRDWDRLFGLDRVNGTLRFEQMKMSPARIERQLQGVRMILTKQVDLDRVRIFYLQSLLPRLMGGEEEDPSDPASLVDVLSTKTGPEERAERARKANSQAEEEYEDDGGWSTGKAIYY